MHAQQLRKTAPSQKYADAVAALASRSVNHSLYPGTSYWSLAKFLRAPFESYAPGSFESLNLSSNPDFDGHSFVTVHTLTSEGASDLRPIKTADDLFTQESNATTNGNQLLFLHGLPSPQWLNAIGGRYRVDPEFYHRHLDFQAIAGRANYFTQPLLPSGLKNTIQLRVTTIGYLQGNKKKQSELDDLRLHCSEEMKAYFIPLKKDKWTPGDSVVRSFSIHDAEHWSIEQELSVYVKPNGPNWTGKSFTVYFSSRLTWHLLCYSNCLAGQWKISRLKPKRPLELLRTRPVGNISNYPAQCARRAEGQGFANGFEKLLPQISKCLAFALSPLLFQESGHCHCCRRCFLRPQ